MKKNFKLVLALIVAAMMIVGSFAAIAAPTDGLQIPDDSSTYDKTLTVSNLTAGDHVDMYQILKWVGSTPSTSDAAYYGGWEAIYPFDTVLTKAVLADILYDDPSTSENEADGISSELAGQLARLVNSNTLTADLQQDVTGNSAEFTVNKALGLYMALITPSDVNTVYNPVFVSTDWSTTNGTNAWAVDESATYDPATAAKKSTVGLTKTAKTSEDPWDDKTNDTISTSEKGKLQWTTTAIGDTVSYTVNTIIPGYGNIYTNPTFILRDHLTDLKLKTDSIKVYAGESAETGTLLSAGTAYTLDPAPTDTDYAVKFDETYLKGLKTAQPITVTYDAVVTNTAPMNVNWEKNEVSTQFSHNPSDSTDFTFKKDTTQHYTFTIDASGIFHNVEESGEYGSELIKIGLDANNKPIMKNSEYTTPLTTKTEVKGPLDGAKFGLYVLNEPAEFPTYDSLTDAQAYKPKDPATGERGDALTQTTGTDGRMTFAGLDAGTYYLKEIEAPAGFVRSNEVLKIVIAADVIKVEVTEWTNDGKTWVAPANSASGMKSWTYETEVLKDYSITVTNSKGESVSTEHFFTNEGNDIVWESSNAGDKEIPTSIPNVQGVELPSTGGIGTTIFYVGGSLMVLAAAILLITKRRMGVED